MKAIGGIIKGIKDPVLLSRKQKLEDEIKQKSGQAGLWDELAASYKELGDYGAEISLLSPSGLNGGIMGYMHQLAGYKQLVTSKSGSEADIAESLKAVKEGAAILKDPKEVTKFTHLMSKMNKYASPGDDYIKGLFRSGSFSSAFPKILESSALTNPAKVDKALKPKKLMKSKDPLFTMATNLTGQYGDCLLYTSPSPRDKRQSRMPSSA